MYRIQKNCDFNEILVARNRLLSSFTVSEHLMTVIIIKLVFKILLTDNIIIRDIKKSPTTFGENI